MAIFRATDFAVTFSQKLATRNKRNEAQIYS